MMNTRSRSGTLKYLLLICTKFCLLSRSLLEEEMELVLKRNATMRVYLTDKRNRHMTLCFLRENHIILSV